MVSSISLKRLIFWNEEAPEVAFAAPLKAAR